MKKTVIIFLIFFLISCTPDLSNLPDKQAQSTQVIELNNNDRYDITANPITKYINNVPYKMLGYNSMVPGPLLKVNRGDTIYVNFTNNIDQNTTIHWHGLRHDNRFDGVPGVTQEPVQPGESFEYKVYFPDYGMYWYHPHIREDRQQDLGLAGNMWVLPRQDIYNSVNKEEVLILDDMLIENKKIVEFPQDYATHALMGRFGNVLLVNGESDYELEVKKGEVVRFYMTNVANTRPFNIEFDGAKIKLIGSDIGKYEYEEFVDSVLIAPAERYIIEVLFDEERDYKLQNVNPQKTYTLGKIKAKGNKIKDYSSEFSETKQDFKVGRSIDPLREFFNMTPNYTIDLTLEMEEMIDMDSGEGMDMMPMDDNKEMPMMNKDAMMMDEDMGDMHDEETIEFEDSMPKMNEASTSKNTKWIIRDRESKKENMDFVMKVKTGDILKIRIFNDPKSMHPMQHPIHLHGQRFLVLEFDGKPNENLVWKDTVLVPKGSTVDILVQVTNPGKWMLHCHISEHLEAGMMSMLEVSE